MSIVNSRRCFSGRKKLFRLAFTPQCANLLSFSLKNRNWMPSSTTWPPFKNSSFHVHSSPAWRRRFQTNFWSTIKVQLPQSFYHKRQRCIHLFKCLIKYLSWSRLLLARVICRGMVPTMTCSREGVGGAERHSTPFVRKRRTKMTASPRLRKTATRLSSRSRALGRAHQEDEG